MTVSEVVPTRNSYFGFDRHGPLEVIKRLSLEALTIYNFIYSGVDETPGVRGNSLKKLVGASGFEPPTSWSRTRRSSQAEPRPDRCCRTSSEFTMDWSASQRLARGMRFLRREPIRFGRGSMLLLNFPLLTDCAARGLDNRNGPAAGFISPSYSRSRMGASARSRVVRRKIRHSY